MTTRVPKILKMLGSIFSSGFARGKVTNLVTVVVALSLALVTPALAANGSNFILGTTSNAATLMTSLTANIANPALRLVNTSTSAGATALKLQTATTKPPMTVTSNTKVPFLNADYLDGWDSSAFPTIYQFGPQQLINTEEGPLPKERTFQNNRPIKVVILASGSGYRDSSLVQQDGPIGMEIYLDNVHVGTAWVTTSEQDSHKAFVADFIVSGDLSPGSHKITLIGMYDVNNCNKPGDSTAYCTTTNASDPFNVTIIPQPVG
jgi:hypothetical protein